MGEDAQGVGGKGASINGESREKTTDCSGREAAHNMRSVAKRHRRACAQRRIIQQPEPFFFNSQDSIRLLGSNAVYPISFLDGLCSSASQVFMLSRYARSRKAVTTSPASAVSRTLLNGERSERVR